MAEEISEIKVLYADSPGSRDTLSDEERYHIFEQLAKTQPEWWKHIQSMVDMLREDTITNQLLIKPDLRELLLRKVITLDKERTKIEGCGALQRVVIPIVRSDSTIKGGAPPHMFIRKKASAVTKTHIEDSPNIIHVRFDTAIQCRRGDLDYIAPAGDDIIIEGWEIRDPDQSVAAQNRGFSSENSTVVTQHFHHQPTFALGNVQWWEIAPRKLTPGRYLLSDMNEKEQLRELTNLFTYFTIVSQPQAFTNLMRAIVSTHAKNTPDVNFTLPDPLLYAPLPKIWIDILAQFNINSDSSRSAIIRDLYHAGIANAFYIALQKGRTDPNVTSALVLRQQQLTREEFRQRMIVADEDRAYKLNTLLVTIAKKISTARAAEVEKKLAMAGGDPLKLLNPQEKKIVEIEVAKREKYLEEVLLNKCPHVKLYKQFRTAATTVDSWKILGDLRHFFDKKASGSTGNMITCNKCALPIVCPHIVALTEAEYLNKKYSETKRIIEEYVDTANTKEYFCKICGELLITSLDTTDDVPIQSINMNEELKTFMWSEMAVLTKFLKFPALINVPALITAQRDACYEDIFRLEKQILKSKTNSAEEIKAKKRLYVSIYSMAYMIQLVLTHKEIEFKGIKPGATLVELIKFGIDQLMIYCNVIIREIPGMTMDIIKGQMIAAYKSIQSAGVIVTTAGEQEDIVTTLLLDPTYNYIVNMWNLSEILSKNRDQNTRGGRFTTAESSIKKIIGDISTIEKNLIVGKTKIPYDLFANANYPQLHADRASPADKPRVSYVVNSFNMFSKWIRDGKFKEPIYTQLGGKTVETVLNPVYQKARDELQQIIKAETEVELARRANFTRVGMSIGRKTPKPVVVTPLGRLYDADGKPHKWSLLVVDNGEKEPAIMTTADISKLVMSGKRFTATIVDKKCETCGMLKSAANDIPESKIRGNLQAMTDRDNFFRFYETRCPKGGAHTMVDVGGAEGLKCSQCGYKPNLTPLAYYKEHLPAWIEEKKGWAVTPPKMVEARVIEWDNSYEKEYASWSYNFNIVLECASKLKINHRLLSVMGATEKVDYAEILSGAYIPPEAENRNDTRIYVLTTHIKNLMTEYLQLKNFHKLTKPSMDLTQVVENSGVGKYRMAEIGAKLPDIFNDFNARFAYIQRTKKPREIVNFCIQAICEMALRIFGLPSDPDHALRKTFIQYFMAKIFKLEETLTKPGYFSWSLLYGDKDQKETKDSNFTADDTDDGTVLDSPQDDEEDTPFGTDAYDMEDDDDPDDPGNQVRAGENLGLD